MPLGMIPPTIIKAIINYGSAHKNIVKIKIPLWQTFGASRNQFSYINQSRSDIL